MHPDLLYQIALTLVPNVGPVLAKSLCEYFGSAQKIFQAKTDQLLRVDGIGEGIARMIRSFNDFKSAETEMLFIEKFSIQPLFILDEAYPKRLRNCFDSPTLLFFKGIADFNTQKVIAVIGTRNHTEYGKAITEKFIAALGAHGILVISGLAYGIDGIAHRSALRHQLPTVGVLAHGLDQIYPSKHSSLARDMINGHGGLLTEFRSRTAPDRHHFPSRNRIVAGMSDATIVVETGAIRKEDR